MLQFGEIQLLSLIWPSSPCTSHKMKGLARHQWKNVDFGWQVAKVAYQREVQDANHDPQFHCSAHIACYIHSNSNMFTSQCKWTGMRGGSDSWSLILVQVNEMCQKMYIKQISPRTESKKNEGSEEWKLRVQDATNVSANTLLRWGIATVKAADDKSGWPNKLIVETTTNLYTCTLKKDKSSKSQD